MRHLFVIASCLLCIGLCNAQTPAPAKNGPEPQAPWPTIQQWGHEPVEIQNDKRATLCLNGAWRFMPAQGEAANQPPQTGWGYIPVPGSWRGHGYWPNALSHGTGDMWTGVRMDQLNRAWYQRAITIPADWTGRAVLLDLQRVSTDAKVFIDGAQIGEIHWPGGEIDLTDHIRPGQSQTLTLLVIATPNQELVQRFMENATAQVTQEKAIVNARGLIGDVLLVSRPAGAHVSDVFVQTSTRHHQLTLNVELKNVTQPANATFTARLLNESGKEEKRFTIQLPVEATDTQTIQPQWTWDNPRLWDIGRPNLYQLELTVEAPGIRDTRTQRFGFREFWIDGKKFFLNGTEIRLRPLVAVTNRPVADLASEMHAQINAGFNFLEVWPEDFDERGTYDTRQYLARLADEMGVLMAGVPLTVARLLRNDQGGYLWDNLEQRADWEHRMAADLRQFRNHPAIVLWACTANYFGHNEDQAPYRIGTPELVADTGWQRRASIGFQSMKLIKKYDPTRHAFTHAGAQVGDVYNTNHYLDLIPLQDREEWLTDYERAASMPFIAIEFGTPFYATMLRGRAGYTIASVSEPLLTEYAAIYLGSRSYQLETPEYRKLIADHFIKDQQYQSWHPSFKLFRQENFQQLEALFVRNTWRSWRSMGITGGMVPWGAGGCLWVRTEQAESPVPTPPWQPGTRGPYRPQHPAFMDKPLQPPAWRTTVSSDALIANNAPTLAWIAGSGPDLADLTDKTHHYRTASTAVKQIILINDTRQEQSYTVQWSVQLTGQDRPLAKSKIEGRIAPAQTILLPITWTMPKTIPDNTPLIAGHVRLDARIGEQSHQDRLDFTLFSQQPTDSKSPALAVFDPEGKTTDLLRRMGFVTQPWDGKSSEHLLVIGRNAFGSQTPLPGDLHDFVKQGGRLIVMAQSPDWFTAHTRFRICDALSRRMFFVDPTGPLAKGLTDDQLRDWAGSSTLVPDHPVFNPMTDPATPGKMPMHGWRTSNRGALSSVCIEKPHRGGWRPLLEGEFDLAYSPLMELDMGKGRMFWCTLDFEDHVPADPAATLLARRFFDYAQNCPLSPRNTLTLYLGDDTGERLLADLGLIHNRAPTLDADAQLLILGPGAKVSDTTLRSYLELGGQVFILPDASPAGPLGLQRQTVDSFIGSLTAPDWPLARGLSASDLRRRADASAQLIQPTDDWQVASDGLLARLTVGTGTAVACQIDPRALNADVKTYLRLTRWRQTRALSQLLANMGGEFRADAQLFDFRTRQALPVAGDWRWKQTLTLPVAGQDKAPAEAPVTPEIMRLVQSDFDDSSWNKLAMPSMIPSFDTTEGQVVLRRAIDVPADWAGKDLTLNLGSIDDFDKTYFNGQCIGQTDKNTPNFWSARRTYKIPASLVRPGRNVIAIVLFDRFGGGGMGGPAKQMTLEPASQIRWEDYYDADYRTDYPLGDDPYRYTRW